MKIRLDTVTLSDEFVKDARRVYEYEQKYDAWGIDETFRIWCKSHLETSGVMGFSESISNRLDEYELN
jgi:zona occludens toxin (predicted ATPase)